MWIVYDHPKDFPNTFVARQWEITAEGGVQRDLMVSPALEPLRQQLEARGLVRLARHPDDDQKIVETWV